MDGEEIEEAREEVARHVSEHTPISMGLFLALCTALGGGVFYLATNLALAGALTSRVDKMENRQENYQNDTTEIKERLARIEELLKWKKK